MKRTCVPFLIVVLAFAVRVRAQEAPSNDEFAPLVLVRIIPMPGVEGRFDHMAVDNRSGRIFAAVYGNDSVEVLDVPRGRRIHSIKDPGFGKPQMVVYIPDSNRIVVSNEADGSCKIFDADTYKLIDSVKYSEDADQLRYDPASKRVYVGYGDDAEGAIGVFDATTNKRLQGDFVVGAHPESFQLEEKGGSRNKFPHGARRTASPVICCRTKARAAIGAGHGYRQADCKLGRRRRHGRHVVRRRPQAHLRPQRRGIYFRLPADRC